MLNNGFSSKIASSYSQMIFWWIFSNYCFQRNKSVKSINKIKISLHYTSSVCGFRPSLMSENPLRPPWNIIGTKPALEFECSNHHYLNFVKNAKYLRLHFFISNFQLDAMSPMIPENLSNSISDENINNGLDSN
jgi:hypothetical protein